MRRTKRGSSLSLPRRVTEIVELLGPDRFTSFGVTAAGHPRSGCSWRFGRHQLADWDFSLVRSS